MGSPFPGMDPYLEDPAFWPDFHPRFINYWSEAIADVLPDHYESRLNERIYLIETDPETRKLIYPDVALTDSGEMLKSFPTTNATATLEPVTIPVQLLGGPRETFIEILQRPERSLVAVLELLSPGNKSGSGRTEYLAKRESILRQQVHLIELDLLKGGRRPPMQGSLPQGDYFYMVSRSEDRLDSHVYAWSVRHSLPRLPVPLRTPDADVIIDYAAIFNNAFERGRFARNLSYHLPCPAPLSDADREWATSLVPSK